MNTVQKLSLASSLLVGAALPAFAGVTVSTPSNGESVRAPFSLSANASTCSSQPIVSMGYSLDNSSDTTITMNDSVSASVDSGSGWHTLHVKAWGNQGAVCVEDVSIDVTTAVSAATPAYAKQNSSIENMSNWKATFDSGTSGSASGHTFLTNSPSRSGSARGFSTSYSHYGGERYNSTFGDDTSSTNFIYDTWIYIAGSAAAIANIEMDLNQVMANGETVIYGIQCDGWSGTWDYTANKGTPSKPVDAWVHTSASCNPRSWQTSTWHHLQVSYSRNGSGYVTYKSITLDGAEHTLNATTLSAFALGWAPTLITNFQVDGYYSGSGSSTIYMDNLNISRW